MRVLFHEIINEVTNFLWSLSLLDAQVRLPLIDLLDELVGQLVLVRQSLSITFRMLLIEEEEEVLFKGVGEVLDVGVGVSGQQTGLERGAVLLNKLRNVAHSDMLKMILNSFCQQELICYITY